MGAATHQSGWKQDKTQEYGEGKLDVFPDHLQEAHHCKPHACPTGLTRLGAD